MKTTFCTVLPVVLAVVCSFASGAEPLRFFVGTYTDRDSQGIYTGTFDPVRGTLEKPTLAAECANPAFFALHPTKPILYVVTETPIGLLLAFQYDKKSGQLTPLDKKEALGQITCHLAFCPSPNEAGGAVVVANYSSGNVVSFPILENGTMGEAASNITHAGSGPNAARQESPHPHGAYFDGRSLAVPDLGIDRVIYYEIDLKTAVLSPSADHASLRLAPGAGPRHLAASKDMQFTFVANELDSTVSVFDRRTAKAPKLLQTISTLSEGKDAAALNNSTAEIELHPNGKFLYVSNRGDDSITVFAVNESKLTFLQNVPTGGKTSRFFCIDPTQRFLLVCNQDSGNICVFRIDPDTGKLAPTGQSVDTPRPINIVFVP